ncbi:MAG TPA: SRPBCC family protein [Solirubrobacteraceae bacterium]
MPRTRRTRTIAAPVQQVWEIVRDPHHLPRWWPRVERVEDVSADAFTEVMRTSKGRVVRADFERLRADEAERALSFCQRVEGTPFARVLRSAETEMRVSAVASPDPATIAEATAVTIEVRQALSGFFPRFGGFMVSRAAAATLDDALDGLERISA